MEEKMNIREFCEKFKEADDVERTTLLVSIIKNEYVSFGVQHTVATAMLHKMLREQDGMYQKNTPYAYLNEVVSFFSLFSNLELVESASETFDLLSECGCINEFTTLNTDRWKLYDYIWEGTLSDLFENQNSVHAFISKQVTRLGNILDGSLKYFAEKMENIDYDKLNAYLDKAKTVTNKAKNDIVNDHKKSTKKVTPIKKKVETEVNVNK